MKKDLKLNKLTSVELQDDLMLSNFSRLYIENSISDSIAVLVNEMLLKTNIPLLIWVDEFGRDYTGNVDVLKNFSNLKDLDIYVASGEISSLEAIKNIRDLETLQLRRTFKKNVSLNVLGKYPDLKFFHLDNGLSARQYSDLNLLEKIEVLRVSDLDLNLLKPMIYLTSLRVFRKLANAELIDERLPELRSLYLEKCKDIQLENSISGLPKIESVWLRYMSHIVSIPRFNNEKGIFLFQTTHLSKLTDIKSVFKMSNLEALMMTDLEHLNTDDFKELEKLKNLKIAYVTFKNKAENSRFEIFAAQNKWSYKQPALVDKKYDL